MSIHDIAVWPAEEEFLQSLAAEWPGVAIQDPRSSWLPGWIIGRFVIIADSNIDGGGLRVMAAPTDTDTLPASASPEMRAFRYALRDRVLDLLDGHPAVARAESMQSCAREASWQRGARLAAMLR